MTLHHIKSQITSLTGMTLCRQFSSGGGQVVAPGSDGAPASTWGGWPGHCVRRNTAGRTPAHCREAGEGGVFLGCDKGLPCPERVLTMGAAMLGT